MQNYNSILLDAKGKVAVLTLNNPENRNPLTEQTKEEILAALEEVERAPHFRALMMTGCGTAFCAGGDIKKISQELTREEISQVMKKSQQLLWKLIEFKKPVVAAVNGDAFGMGFNLVLTADFAIASEKARFSQAFVKLGLMPDFGALYFLPRLIGLWKTKELVYFGGTLTAAEARGIGLLYQVVPHDYLEKEAMGLANRLAELPTKAVGQAKKVLSRTFEMTLMEILEEEIRAQTLLSQTEDHREAIRALSEKRQPMFQGK
jgi:2-(1,2-epoxy-1,2-dihydrophenyl)acetyl-CoA isomerase